MTRGAFFDYAEIFGHSGEMQEEEDVKIESEDSEADLKADKKITKMRGEIEQLRKEKQEYLDGWQRAKADYVNALKRFEGERKGASHAGLLRAIEAFLPAFDALERAGRHGELSKGFQAIVKQLEAAFKELGVAAIGEVGEKFDPAFHEALGQDAVEKAEKDGEVTAVLEKGWRIGENVIRPAKVRVGKH
ncbi:nucleotide exchange factor GrpE [Candidatus Kaiserbacteria bacterium RIFCSPHIGHO2_12_FULL_56_13]|uniref:Protein GrpE n=2 Tax=Candidatus Kaiseribacteriota TaxID=1752734 RepID=A0A1F6E416_9BACT|nr:MAG: nucleotide exchange factor GrpE [Candidatus Kaiserbacteria bacterium RIFCSPHIGHO2_02_FULL_56_30]OGG72113.1 MAG: nucleotide exchange factor GrpE [Candidatus Kaiserbacteria bacterium RIFCSPHIGHO2_12_FULL_56_13]